MINETELLSMIQYLTGAKGSKVVSGTTPEVANFRAFEINTDAVVTQLLDENGNNLLTSMGLSGITLTTGRYLTPRNAKHFSSITLASGSVVIYYI